MAANQKILIVEARFYSDIADELARGVIAVLNPAGIEYNRVEVPGVFEVPAAVSFGLESGEYDGVIALGCVIRGETDHYDHICREASRALMELAVDRSAPLGFGILTCENRDQARVRAAVDQKDVGGRSAEACLRMMELKQQLRAGP